jgi:hypothetical protein
MVFGVDNVKKSKESTAGTPSMDSGNIPVRPTPAEKQKEMEKYEKELKNERRAECQELFRNRGRFAP